MFTRKLIRGFAASVVLAAGLGTVLTSCEPPEEKFAKNHVQVSFNLDLDEALASGAYDCPSVLAPRDVFGESGAQVGIPRAGAEADVAYLNGIAIDWFGLIVDVVGQREDGSEETLISEANQGVVRMPSGKYAWGGLWDPELSEVSIDRMNENRFKKMKFQVTYVAPCRTCWEDMGAPAREIWKGESQWLTNNSTLREHMVTLNFVEAKVANSQGAPACQ